MTYRLPQHVHFCCDDAWCVFLDLVRDRYHCVPRTRLESFEPTLLARMDVMGLLTVESESARTLQPTAGFRAENSLEELDAADVEHPDGGIVSFWRACTAADFRLRWGRLIETVLEAARWKRQALQAFDWTAVGAGVRFFQNLRPWYPRDYLCLFDSLALFRLLALRGTAVDWVFGVRAEPFEAHCWLQKEGTVLNDSVERAGSFVPILVV